MPGQPAPDPPVTMSAIVVEDQVQGFLARELGIESLEKLQKLLMPMPRIALADHPAFDDLQGGKQRRGAVAVIVVRVGATATALERQTGLRAIQRLNLTL